MEKWKKNPFRNIKVIQDIYYKRLYDIINEKSQPHSL